MKLKDIIHKVSHQGEQKWDILKTKLKTRLGLDEPVMILPYRSFGNPKKAFFWGRVLEAKEEDKKAPLTLEEAVVEGDIKVE